MQLASHLRLSRCGIYQFRLVLPANIAALLGQKSIIQSLNTKRPERARLAAYAISAKIVPLLREMRRAMTFDPNDFDGKNARELIVKNLRITPEGGLSVDHIETSSDPVVAAQEMRMLERLRRPARELMPISAENAKAILADADIFADIIDGNMAATAAIRSTPPELACTIQEAIDGFMAHKSGTAKTTQLAYKRRLKIFAQLAGGESTLLHEITPARCVRIAEALNRLGSHVGGVPDAETVLANPPNGKMLAKQTVKDYLILIQDFFDWAIGSLRYPKGDNPFADIVKPSEGNHKSTGVGAQVFLQSELEKIFRPEHFADMKRPYQFWGPLIALFTGARSNEIAQLRVSDITRENGILCMSITHEPMHPVPTRTKNPSSVRILPLHPRLLEIGFEAYWHDMQAIGAQRLFGLSAAEDGKCERYLSRDFNEGLAVKAGVYKHRQKTLHSFRDTVSSALGDDKVWGPYIDQWLGHAPQTTQSKSYAKKLTEPDVLEQIFPALKFDFLDFSKIRYRKGAWSEWVKSQMQPKVQRKPRVPPKEMKAIVAARKQGRTDLIAKKGGKKPISSS